MYDIHFLRFYSLLFNSCSSTDWSIHAFRLYTKTIRKAQKQNTTHDESLLFFFVRSQLFSMLIPTPCSFRLYITNTHAARASARKHVLKQKQKHKHIGNAHIHIGPSACTNVMCVCTSKQTGRSNNTVHKSCTHTHRIARGVLVHSLDSIRLICVSFPRSLPFTVSLSFSCLQLCVSVCMCARDPNNTHTRCAVILQRNTLK